MAVKDPNVLIRSNLKAYSHTVTFSVSQYVQPGWSSLAMPMFA